MTKDQILEHTQKLGFELTKEATVTKEENRSFFDSLLNKPVVSRDYPMLVYERDVTDDYIIKLLIAIDKNGHGAERYVYIYLFTYDQETDEEHCISDEVISEDEFLSTHNYGVRNGRLFKLIKPNKNKLPIFIGQNSPF